MDKEKRVALCLSGTAIVRQVNKGEHPIHLFECPFCNKTGLVTRVERAEGTVRCLSCDSEFRIPKESRE